VGIIHIYPHYPASSFYLIKSIYKSLSSYPYLKTPFRESLS